MLRFLACLAVCFVLFVPSSSRAQALKPFQEQARASFFKELTGAGGPADDVKSTPLARMNAKCGTRAILKSDFSRYTQEMANNRVSPASCNDVMAGLEGLCDASEEGEIFKRWIQERVKVINCAWGEQTHSKADEDCRLDGGTFTLFLNSDPDINKRHYNTNTFIQQFFLGKVRAEAAPRAGTLAPFQEEARMMFYRAMQGAKDMREDDVKDTPLVWMNSRCGTNITLTSDFSKFTREMAIRRYWSRPIPDFQATMAHPDGGCGSVVKALDDICGPDKAGSPYQKALRQKMKVIECGWSPGTGHMKASDDMRLENGTFTYIQNMDPDDNKHHYNLDEFVVKFLEKALDSK